jgi:hypothetical protein
MSILEDAVLRRLRIECSEISLTKGGATPLNFKGPGTIWIDESGQIQFEFELSQEAEKIYDLTVVRQQYEAPEEPKDMDYFALAATSDSREVYQGRILYPDRGDKPGLAKGKLMQLESSRQLSESEPSVARMLIRKKINFPQIQHLGEAISPKEYCWLDFANGEKIELFDRGDYTEVVCSVESAGIAKNHHWRMIEAVEFAFGQSFYPCAIEQREGTKLAFGFNSPIPGLTNEGQLAPPLELTGKIHYYAVTDLVQKFYRYVLPYPEESQPLIAHGIWGMRQAADAQPDIKGLVFAIAAETLIQACFPRITPVPNAFREKVKALQDKLKADETLDPDLRERAVNKLNSLTDLPNSTKIRDFLRWHVRSKKHQEEIFQAWSRLRNSAAHGTKTALDFEKTLRRIRVTRDLCYVIVFSRIGFYHERKWKIEARLYENSWSIRSLNQSDLGKPPLGSIIVPSLFQWKMKDGVFIKNVPVRKEPEQSITLIVRPRKEGSPEYRIEVGPEAILPDDIASFEIATEYPALKEAMAACDKIAARALLHISVEHFS